MKYKLISITSALLLSLSVVASNETITIGDVEMASDAKSAAFEQVKKKLGKWEGTMVQGLNGAVIDVSYEFAMTSGGNTITETLVEDGVQMLTTYSDDDGELVIRHYCGLGTEPVFKVENLSTKGMSIILDQSKADLHAEHESFVTNMKWIMNSKDSITFENIVMLDGEPTNNIAQLKRVY
ncbi:hypothetical protein N9450_04690 [Gammaproteobacteria bacterium]|jgi:hypothetical protein|nr:hypothetical protein [Gammaproteobacteria bacterium]MDC0546404.1 hypothetical protein [Gammaproteobacteria bacterium]MDC3323557.1 hypothetical protein [Gammaproteobacteria bacterium]